MTFEFSILDVCFLVGMCAVFAFDYWLAITPGRQTISIMTWLAEKTHPTLILGVAVVGMCGAYFAQGDFPVCFSIALTTGHLCTSEGAAVASVGRKLRKEPAP
jgi:hypothetical protein